MFWSPSPIIPIEQDQAQALDKHVAWLIREFGVEYFRNVTVVPADSQSFPRAREGTVDGIQDTFGRVCGYMGVERGMVGLWLYEPDQPPLREYQQVWQAEGPAGLFEATADVDGPMMLVGLNVEYVEEPLFMIAVMAHELAHVRLHRRVTNCRDQREEEHLTDTTTVFLGMGLFTANAITWEAHGHNPWIEGAWSAAGRLGYLRGPEFGYVLALFLRLRGEEAPVWSRSLRKDVEVPFRQMMAYCQKHGDPDVIKVDAG